MKTASELRREGPNTPEAGAPVKLSINISSELGDRLRKLAFQERLSRSSIVEVALAAFFGGRGDADVSRSLREHGASLRRAAAPHEKP